MVEGKLSIVKKLAYSLRVVYVGTSVLKASESISQWFVEEPKSFYMVMSSLVLLARRE